MASRPKVSAKDKQQVLENADSKCYVCEDLDLKHAGFSGYDKAWVHFDHYRRPSASVGSDKDGNPLDILPIHAAPGGDTPDDTGFEDSVRRNCHKFRRDEFSSRADYVTVIRARLGARDAEFLDDVAENRERHPDEIQYKIPIEWSGLEATFGGDSYSVIEEVRRGVQWQRFLTRLPLRLLFTDHQSQVRPATKNVIHKMIATYLVQGYPTFAPVNARVDKCGHVVVFDGNHRATSFALSFGLEETIPVMIWNIESGGACAIEAGGS